MVLLVSKNGFSSGSRPPNMSVARPAPGYGEWRQWTLSRYRRLAEHIYADPGDALTTSYRGQRWDGQAYVAAVEHTFRRMREGSEVARVILGAIVRDVVIVPYQNEDPFSINAVARPVLSIVRPGGSPPTTSGRAMENASLPGIAIRGFSGTGNGTGSQVVVEFTPGFFNNSSPLFVEGQTFRGDAAILHELVHAMRITRGVFDNRSTTGPLAPYHMNDEFFGVMITNMWRSERGIRPLRANHGRAYVPLTDAHRFHTVPHNRTMIERFSAEQTQVAAALSLLNVPFNPLKAWLDDGGAAAGSA